MKRNLSLVSVFTAAALLLAACAMPPPKVEMTPVQIQAMQTKTFKTSKRKAFNAAMQVFQDMGYTVQSANYDTGFISGHSMTKPGNSRFNHFNGNMKALQLLSSWGAGSDVRTSSLQKVTAFVSQLPQHKAKVRISLVDVVKTSVKGGSPDENDTQNLSAKAYDKLFNRLSQALFVGNAATA